MSAIDDWVETLAGRGASTGASEEREAEMLRTLLLLERLVADAAEGDLIYLHLSGHGSQQPQGRTDQDHELDGLDEIFLPRDIGRWDEPKQSIENAIIDDELGELIDRMRSKGAFVWLVADLCHAGTMVRGALPTDIEYRHVSPGMLGAPKTATMGVGISQQVETDVLVDALSVRHIVRSPTKLGTPSRERGGYVAFYAARANQLAPELKLPAGAVDARWHGLLTRTLAEALAASGTTTYRRLGQQVLQQYASRRAPTPIFVGSGLDATVAGFTEGIDAPTPSQQWRIGKRHRPPGLIIPVGRLARIHVGSRFALLANPSDKTEQALGFSEVETSRDLSADLKPIALRGKSALKLDAVPPDAYARLLNRIIDFQVTIVRPPLLADASDQERSAAHLVERIATETPESGIGFRWVRPGEPADLRLGFTPRGRSDCDSLGAAGQRLWIAAADGGIRCRGDEPTTAIRLDQSPEAIERELRGRLRSMAKVLNLSRIAATLNSSSGEAEFDVNLHILPAGGEDRPESMLMSPEQVAEPRPGDGMQLSLMNSGPTLLDVTVLFVDGRYGIKPVYPGRDDSPTLGPGEQSKLIKGTISDKTLGQEQLIVIAVEQRRQDVPLDFRFLAQPTLDRNRSEAPPRGDMDLRSLFEAAGFGVGGTRGEYDPFDRKAKMKVYRWRLRRKGVGF